MRTNKPALCSSLVLALAVFGVAEVVPAGTMPSLVSIPQSGGYADAGAVGEYFANETLSDAPVFVRRDVRIDFDLGERSIAGSPGEPYKSFPADHFSVRWTGKLLPRFTETYTLHARADDGVRVFVKKVGEDWKPVIDAWDNVGGVTDKTGAVDFTAGESYDLRVEYKDVTGAAAMKLAWSSPSTPEQTIEPASGLAINVYSEGFTDAMKGARDEWKAADDGPERDARRDENGWPLEDARCMIWEGTDKHEGTYLLTFKGTADLSVQFNYANFENQTYDPTTNITTANMVVTDTSRQNFNLIFKNTKRDANSASNSGVTDVRVYMPTAVGSDKPYAADSLYIDQYKKQLNRFVALRFMGGTNWNNSITWADATPVTYSTQRRINAPVERWGQKWETSGFEANGIAWEYKIALANETGKDLYVCVPEMADDAYITNLANALKYGTDGRQPYTGVQVNPVYPPLNSNLKVYVEMSNEVWNVGFAQWHQNFRAAEEAVKNLTDEGKALAFDQEDPQRLDANVRWGRRHVYQTVRMSNLFRKVFGDDQTNTEAGRVRILHFWQYDNSGWPPTAGVQMGFLDDYFNNGDGKQHVPEPHAPSYYVWGAGGATYFNAVNERGRTTLLKDGAFESPVTQDRTENPTGVGEWTFNGAAGIARCGGPSGAPETAQQKNEAEQRNGNQPAAPVEQQAAHNDQAAYLKTGGSFSTTITIPSDGKANQFAVEFQSSRPKDGSDQPFDIYVGEKLLTRGNAWEKGMRPNQDWREYSSKVFTAEPGSTQTIRFVAVDGNDVKPESISFIDNVSVTSADAIFAADIPASGYNNVQEASTANYQRRLDGTGNWALAYGLRFAGYEGGWALGGDAGGSEIQNWAKFNDPRATEAQQKSIHAMYNAIGSLYTFGTYSQWSSWDEAEKQPLTKGIEVANAKLPEPSSRLIKFPGELTQANRAMDWGFKDNTPPESGPIDGRHMLAWFGTVDKAGNYSLDVQTEAGGKVSLIVDGVVVASGAGGTTLNAKVSLAAGVHAVLVRALEGSFVVSKVTVSQE